MDVTFFNRIANSNASKNCRNDIRDFVLENPEYLMSIVAFAIDLTNKNHYKAVWIIEMLAETHPEFIAPFTNQICNVATKYKHDSAIRGISRTILFLTTSKKTLLTEEQQGRFIEISIDRLIGDDNVAPKVFAMYALSHLAKKHDWLKEELQHIINKDFAEQSAGYKARLRSVKETK